MEAILFTMGESVELTKIANTIELDAKETKKILEDFTVSVTYDQITEKNYSLSAGQYFDVKIEISLLNSSLVTLTGITSSTSILGSVIVPVLSTHSTLTRANVSTLFIS